MKKILTARQTPLHLCPGAENVVQILVEGDVIETISEKTDWIGAGMLVKKMNPDVNMFIFLPKSLFFLMRTCASKFTFLYQKRADFPNFGAQNSTVTFFLERRPLKAHTQQEDVDETVLGGHENQRHLEKKGNIGSTGSQMECSVMIHNLGLKGFKIYVILIKQQYCTARTVQKVSFR